MQAHERAGCIHAGGTAMLRRLIAGCLGVLVGLLLAEGALRLYLALVPPPPDATYRADEAAGYLLVPDPPAHADLAPDDHVNALGFRDREHEIAKPPGTLRIAGIGDSFVYGSTPELEDHFLRVAAKRLASSATASDPSRIEAGHRDGDSLRVEMILMGLGGYSPEQYPGVLRGHALPLAPDLVILNLYVGNDVTGIPLRGEVWRGRLYHTGSAYPWLNALRRARIFVLAERVARTGLRERLVEIWLGLTGAGRAARDRPRPPAEQTPRGAAEPPAVTTWRAHQQKKDLPVYAIALDRATGRLWRRAEARLDEFDRLCRASGVPWVLHLIPADIQVDPLLRARVLESLRLDPARYDFDSPQRRWAAWAEARGVPVVDPLPAMRAVAVETPSGGPAAALYETRDIHWTVRGNRLAGEILGEALAGTCASRALAGFRPVG